MNASAHIRGATKNLAQQPGIDRSLVDQKNLVRVGIDREGRHRQRPVWADQIAQQVDHLACAQRHIEELVPRGVDVNRSARRHPEIDQSLPQFRNGNLPPMDFLRQPQLPGAQEAAHVAPPKQLLRDAFGGAANNARRGFLRHGRAICWTSYTMGSITSNASCALATPMVAAWSVAVLGNRRDMT